VFYVENLVPSRPRIFGVEWKTGLTCGLWEAGKFNALVQDIEAAAMQSVGGGRRTVDPDQIARNYNASVLDGNIRAAVRSVTNRDGGGVLLPEDLCTKTGRPVFEVLESKHPDTRIPNLDDPNNIAFEEYEELPDPIPLECLPETLEKVALRLHGSSGPSSVDAAALKTYLLRYGRSSAELREEMAAWAEWLGNDSPPWAAIRGIMTRRLVALDKQPGVRPVGIGEIYLRCICKGALTDVAAEGKAACGSVQLCGGLEAGIEGALHAVEARAKTDEAMIFEDWEIDDQLWLDESEEGEIPPWESEPSDDDEDGHGDGGPVGSTAVDAENGFNNLNKMGALWTVRHRWARGSRFTFNCYRHYARLIVRVPGSKPRILLSREGVTQGCVLAMMVYGVALLPLAEKLREAVPTVLQPWYADDFLLMGGAKDNAEGFSLLVKHGPSVGYFPEPSKSIHICPRGEEAAAKRYFEEKDLDVKLSRGHRYVGGFLGSRKMLERWIAPKVAAAGWAAGVEELLLV
jgi:hypothetical protein